MKVVAWQNLWNSQSTDAVPELPHSGEFLRQMKSIIEQSKARNIAEFQRSNSAIKPYLVICPTTGRICSPVRTIVTRDKTVFIEYDGIPAFWLALSNLAKGYPPSALYFEPEDVLFKFDDSVWGVREPHIAELRHAISDLQFEPSLTLEKGQNLLITGDQNFAHVLWNQLPALVDILGNEAYSDAKVAVTHEPLGPLERLVPGLTSDRVIRLSPFMLLNEVNRAQAFINTPGSLKIPSEIMERVKLVCTELSSPRAQAIGNSIDQSNCPTVWISLREHERTAGNQKELVELLIRRIFETYDSINIVLDGFSLPNDIIDNYDYSEEFRPMAEKTALLAENIIENIQAMVPPVESKKIYNTCGMSVSDSLFLSMKANFYFCHHGTVQHKVGWLANCYGMVHSNTEVIDSKPEQWAASMIEGGVVPVYVKRAFVQDVVVAGLQSDDRIRELRRGNYVFLNIERLVNDILVHLEIALHHGAYALSHEKMPINRQHILETDDYDMADLTHSARRLNALAAAFDAKTYLEIGVEKGQTFFDVAVADKVAVDPQFLFDIKSRETSSTHFFQCPSDKFFQSYHGAPFDLVFLDGLHHFEQTLRDLMNALVFSHEKTLILIDDVFPTDAFSGLREHGDANYFRSQAGNEGQAWHGDVYKLIYFIHDFLPTLSYVTIDDGWNRQTLLWKKPRAEFEPVFNDVEKISRLTYFDIHKHLKVMRFVPENEALAMAIESLSSSESVTQLDVLRPSLALRLTRKLNSVFSR